MTKLDTSVPHMMVTLRLSFSDREDIFLFFCCDVPFVEVKLTVLVVLADLMRVVERRRTINP